MASGMGTQLTTQAPGEKRVRSPFLKRTLWRFKQFLKHTIGDTHFYHILHTAYHLNNEVKRRNSAKLCLEKTKTQKQAQEQALSAPFTPVAILCEKHGPSYVSGFPNGPCPLCLQEQQQRASFTPLYVSRVPLKPIYGGIPIEVERPGKYAGFPRATVRLTPIHLEPLPAQVGETPQEALFLLDQVPTLKIEPDSDATVKREAVRKAG